MIELGSVPQQRLELGFLGGQGQLCSSLFTQPSPEEPKFKPLSWKSIEASSRHSMKRGKICILLYTWALGLRWTGVREDLCCYDMISSKLVSETIDQVVQLGFENDPTGGKYSNTGYKVVYSACIYIPFSSSKF